MIKNKVFQHMLFVDVYIIVVNSIHYIEITLIIAQ